MFPPTWKTEILRQIFFHECEPLEGVGAREKQKFFLIQVWTSLIRIPTWNLGSKLFSTFEIANEVKEETRNICSSIERVALLTILSGREPGARFV